MKVLQIIDLDLPAKRNPGVIAVVFSNLDGTFRVEANDPEVQQHFSAVIAEVARQHFELSYKTGGKTTAPDGRTIFKHGRDYVASSDPMYLTAMWDYFNATPEALKFKDKYIVVQTSEVEAE